MHRFAVVRVIPEYNDRDGICAWRRQRVAATMTAAWAHKLADLQDCDGTDETSVNVIDLASGRVVFRDWPTATLSDPF